MRWLLVLVVTALAAAMVPASPVQAQEADGGQYVALTPERLLDTRDATGDVDAALGTQTTVSQQVAGEGSVPADAEAVAINVTAVSPTALSFLTVYPSGEARPLAASLNFPAGRDVGNMVITDLGDDGQVDIFNRHGQVHVVFDVMGYFPAGADYEGLTPGRVLDTRETQSMGTDETRAVNITDQVGVPEASEVEAVVMNVTAVAPDRPSFLTVYPTAESRPTAASLNFESGQTVGNMVVAEPDAAGNVNMYNLRGDVDVVFDVVGYFPTDSEYEALEPGRVLDTRDGTHGDLSQPLGADSVGTTTIAGQAGVPEDARAVAVNITAVDPTHNTFLTVYPTGDDRPTAATVNPPAGLNTGNMVIVPLGDDGQVDIYNLRGNVDVVMDVVGFFPGVPDEEPQPVSLVGDGLLVIDDGDGEPTELPYVCEEEDESDCVRIDGEMDADGNLTIGPDDVSFPTLEQQEESDGFTLNLLIDVLADDGLSGTYDADSGELSLDGDLRIRIREENGLIVDDPECSTDPFTIGAEGVYQSPDGVVDGDFTVPAFEGCQSVLGDDVSDDINEGFGTPGDGHLELFVGDAPVDLDVPPFVGNGLLVVDDGEGEPTELPYVCEEEDESDCVRIDGEMDADGNLTIGPDDVSFPTLEQQQEAEGFTLNLRIDVLAADGLSGTYDADSGELSLDGDLRVRIREENGLIVDDPECSTDPFTIGAEGVYQSPDGVVDGDFTVPAFEGCESVLGEDVSDDINEGFGTPGAGELTLFAEPPDTGSVSGTVTDENSGAGIEGASVSADGSSTTTDEDGDYVIDGLAEDTYTVTAEADGYEPASEEDVEVVAGEDTTVDFALTPVPMALSQERDASFLDHPDHTVDAEIFVEEAGESTEVTFEVHRFGEVEDEEEHLGTHRGTASTGGDDHVATFTYDADAPGAAPQHGDEDVIVACLDDECSEVDDGEVVITTGEAVANVLGHEWVLADTSTDDQPEGWVPGVLPADMTWAAEAEPFGSVTDLAARVGSSASIGFRFHVATGLFETRGEALVTSEIPQDGEPAGSNFHLHAGAVDENGPVIMPLVTPEPQFDPEEADFGSGELFPYSLDGTAQERGASGQLAAMGAQLQNWDMGELFVTDADPGIDYYFNIHTVDNPGGEVRGQLPIGSTGLGGLLGGTELPPVFQQVDDGATMQFGGLTAQQLDLTFTEEVVDRGAEPFGDPPLTGADFTVTVNGEQVGVAMGADNWAEEDTTHSIWIDRVLEIGDEVTVDIDADAAEQIEGEEHDRRQYHDVSASVLQRSLLVGTGPDGEPMAELAGTVTDAADDEPIAGAEIDLWDVTLPEQETPVASAETGADGEYQFRVEPGEYDVEASADGYIGQTEEGVELEPITSTTVDFALEGLSTIEGTVGDDDGEPIEGATLTLDGDPIGDPRAATTDEDGAYEFAGLQPGDYEVTAEADGFESATEEVEVEAATTHTVDFALGALDSLAVTLEDVEDAYLQGASSTGDEHVAFDYDEGVGDIEQIFNVLTILDEDGEEVPDETYAELFAELEYDDYIRGLEGTTEDNVVAPETRDVELEFRLHRDAPHGDYTVVITSYDVTGVDPGDVSLEDVDDYEILDSDGHDVTVLRPADPQIELEGPEDPTVTGEPTDGMSMRVLNAGDVDLQENAEVRVFIDRDGDLEEGDVTLEFHDGDDWQELALTEEDGELAGRFGPGAGFEVPADHDETTPLRATFEEGGEYSVVTDLHGVPSGVGYDTDGVAFAVQQVQVDLDGPDEVEAGEADDGFTAQLRELAGIGLDENAEVIFAIGHDDVDLEEGDVTLEFHDGDDWQELTLTEEDGELEGRFGPGDGFAVDAGYDETTPLRATFEVEGDHVGSAEVVGVDTGTVYDADTHAVTALAPADPQIELDGPDEVVAGEQTEGYSARVLNAGEVDLDENAEVQFSITRDGGIEDGDVTLEYQDDQGDWHELDLTEENGELTGRFGPGDGFPIDADYDETTPLRATLHEPDEYSSTATVVGVDTDTEYDDDALTVTALAPAEPEITLTGPTSADVDEERDFTSRLRNLGEVDLDENAEVQFSITRDLDTISEDDVTIEFRDDQGDWHELDVTEEDGELTGRFGPPEGFPMDAGYDETTLLRVTFHEGDEYSATVTVVGVDSGTEYDEDDHEVTVGLLL